MPALGYAKRSLGARLGSGATAGEGTQNLLCAAQAAAVLAGLAATAALGWSWLDPAVALLLGRLGGPRGHRCLARRRLLLTTQPATAPDGLW